MNLTIDKREAEGIVFLDLIGPLILGKQDSDLRDQLNLLLQARKVTVALNLLKVTKIDSTGLGMIVAAHVRLNKEGGRLVLFGLNPTHMSLMLFTKLDTVFEIYPTEQDAVSSFFPDRTAKSNDILAFVQSQDENEIPAIGNPAIT